MERQIELEHRVTETEERSKSNTKRIDKLEKVMESIQNLAQSMERMTLQQQQMGESLNKLTGDVETMKAEPGKKWRFVVEKAIYFVVGSLIAFVMAKVGFS